MNVTVEPINVGDIAKIIVELPENATGNVTIEIDGVKYTTDNITAGKAVFEIENLTAGNKTIAVEYSGDDNYIANHTSAVISVSKLTPEVNITVTQEGDDIIINVTAPADATRPVLVDVGGVGYYVNLTDGKGTLVIPRLASGNYNVTARYLGDDKYGPSQANKSFEVEEVPSFVTVTVENITVGDKAIIEITVPDDATGNVTVTVDGKDYNVTVADGKGTLVVPGLKADNYTVTVKYLGDGKYASSENSTDFTVSKITSDIKVIDQGNGTIVVVVPQNATGKVSIDVDGETYVANVTDGMAVINLDNVTPGKHNITATYSGDENYTPASGNTTVGVPKYTTPMDVMNVTSIKVGDAEVIVVSLPENATGDVTVEIDGVKYTQTLDKGKATFTIENLTAGNKTAIIKYLGDDDYATNSTSVDFTVSKRESSVNVTVNR
jgi:hypothetical protein